MNALAPRLELGVLGLVDVRAGLAVREVVEGLAVGEAMRGVGGLNLLDAQALVPREEQRLARAAVVLDVALSTHERAHLLARRVHVRVVRRGAIAVAPAPDARQVWHRLVARRQRRDAAHEAGSGHAIAVDVSGA